MTSPRQPIDRLVDLAIAVPSCGLAAARRAVPLAARVGALTTVRLIDRVSGAVHHRRASVDPIGQGPVVVDIEVDVTTPDDQDEPVSLDRLAIAGYDDLAARQVVARLADLDPDDLDLIERYERANRSRSTVLGKIALLTG